MRKKFRKWYALALSALLSAIGFSSCGSHKPVSEPDALYDPSKPEVLPDSTVRQPKPPAPPPVVYGPPPVGYRK